MHGTKSLIKLVLAGIIGMLSVYGVLIQVNPDPFNITSDSLKANISELGKDNNILYDVLSVVDGDTIKVSDLGTIRLIGIDTPETKDPRKGVQCFGIEASNKASELLSGSRVYIKFDNETDTKDRYNRTLAYVHTEEGLDFNAEMIKQGFAYSYKGEKHSRLDEFNQLESQAKASQVGLWSIDTCNGIPSVVE